MSIEKALRPPVDGPGRDAAARAAGRLTRRAFDEGLVDVAYTTIDSPLGPLLAAATERGLVWLAYEADRRVGELLAQLAARVSPRVLESAGRLAEVSRQLDEDFARSRRRFELETDPVLIGPFARRVLRCTSDIPYGGHLSYREVAMEAGSPGAARAAGNALAANPIPIVIPCHRVLHSGGGLGGYGGGLERKARLLELEGVPIGRAARNRSADRRGTATLP